MYIREVPHFIRIKVCLYVTSLALTGYLLFNTINARLPFVALTVFTLTAGIYALNRRRDRHEDELNRRIMNPLVINDAGKMLITAFLSISMLSVIPLSNYSKTFYLIGLVFGIMYYKIPVKKITRIKNIYTMLSMSAMFMLGATSTSAPTHVLLPYYLLICLYILSISILADIRDYKGDKQVGVASIPIVYGYDNSKNLVILLLFVSILTAVSMKLSIFYLAIPFIPLAAYFIRRNMMQTAYNSLFLSFLIMPVSAIALSII